MTRQMLVLASTSPRRICLLRDLGIIFESVDPGNAENSISIDPTTHVRDHALSKAKSVAEKHQDRLVLAADTIVVLDGRIIEKPRDVNEAKRMLHTLCGRKHTVISAIALVEESRGYIDLRTEETRVTMKRLSDVEIDAYVATGEPMDKAGAYAAQGVGAFMIESVEGDFYNVVGLPLSLLYDMLRDAGFPVLSI